MKYPKLWKIIINWSGYIAGLLIVIIALLQIMEVVLRYFFGHPTQWSLNVSSYLICYCMFLGSAYCFQEQGHVAVDMIRSWADKHDKTGRRVGRRVLAIIGYVASMVYIITLLIGIWNLLVRAIQYHRVTLQIPPIPLWTLLVPMIIGIALMMITLLFMSLDSMTDSDRYL
jgi:TRAP-type C4-dicarboxylate transport system permease small subunit